MPKKHPRSVAKRVGSSLPPNPTKTDVYRAAKVMVRSGLSVIPILADGTKRPAYRLLPPVWSEAGQKFTRQWKKYTSRLPTVSELRSWFRDSSEDIEYGVAVIGGEVSGGVEIVDLDNWDVVEPWSALVEEQAPGLLDRLVRVKSPRPGLHVYYRCAVFGGSHKLAMVPDPEHGGTKPKGVIELKGAAGYCLAPPSPAACHKTNRPYVYDGDLDLTQIPTITPREREVLLSSARRLNVWEANRKPYSPKVRSTSGGGLVRPGDAFDAQADWGDVLTPHGWTWVRASAAGSNQWCRPNNPRR